MSELFKEYTHVVTDPTKQWPYFDIPGCLKMLSWSVDECFVCIWPQYIENSSLTRHAVVQLALYTCQPFRDIPPPPTDIISSEREVYLLDEYNQENGDKKQRKYSCRSVISIVEALATALMHYEDRCERTYAWPAFQEKQDICIQHLENVRQLFSALRKRHITPEDPLLQNMRLPQSDPMQEMINILQAITENDYQHAGGPTGTPHDPRTQLNKWMLLSEMSEAFRPIKWGKEARYRALAAIMKQMQICNANGSEWTPGAIKAFLRRPPDQHLNVTIKLTRPNIAPWYTRPQ
jgi:hypothetical protein